VTDISHKKNTTLYLSLYISRRKDIMSYNQIKMDRRIERW